MRILGMKKGKKLSAFNQNLYIKKRRLLMYFGKRIQRNQKSLWKIQLYMHADQQIVMDG